MNDVLCRDGVKGIQFSHYTKDSAKIERQRQKYEIK